MEEKPGKLGCAHEWVYDTAVIATYPACRHRICSVCGRLEHAWEKPGPAFASSFQGLYERFYPTPMTLSDGGGVGATLPRSGQNRGPVGGNHAKQ